MFFNTCFSDWEIERVSAEIPKVEEEKTLEQLIEELDALVGLTEVKKEIKRLIAVQQNDTWRKLHNLPTLTPNLHMVFIGNPGTGKTTVARLLGKIYRAIGVLSQGQLVEVGREDLVASYVGQTALKTLNAIERAQGGILFIDEAYMLSSGGKQDFEKEAIDTLLRHMEKNRSDMVVIVAGYPNEMDRFIQSDPGLESRLTTTVDFEDYSINQLMEILELQCVKKGYWMMEEAKKRARDVLLSEKSRSGQDFGNGRVVRNVLEAAILNQNDRISVVDDLTDEEMMALTEEDFSYMCFSDWGIERVSVEIPKVEEEKTLEQLIEELDALVGLTEVKEKIRGLVAVHAWEKIHNPPILTSGLHMVFAGNPGTGKTTVARLLGKIYRAIGVLSQGQLVKVGREDLVGQYVGHTVQKTKTVLDAAKGGVLFIDEAYTLSNSTVDVFGQEAILRHMENSGDDMVVVVAIYPDDMEKFISFNPRFSSRFTYIHFDDYSVDELMEIIRGMAEKSGYSFGKDSLQHIEGIIEKGKKAGGRNFGNGRYVRNLYESAVRKLKNRVMTQQVYSDEEMITFDASDFLLPNIINDEEFVQDKTTK